MQLLRNRLVTTARKSIRKNASLGQLYGNMQEAYHQMQTPLVYQEPSAVVGLLRMLDLNFRIKCSHPFLQIKATKKSYFRNSKDKNQGTNDNQAHRQAGAYWGYSSNQSMH
jgi:hypothetical protein